MRRILTLPLAGVALFATLEAHAASVTLKPGDDVKTLTASLQPGDVITFTDGTYEIPSTLDWTNSGDAGSTQTITFKAADGARPVLLATGDYLIASLHDVSNVVIEGLVFSGENFPEEHGFNGLQITRGDNIAVRNCEFAYIDGAGIYVPGDSNGITIEHNAFHDLVEGEGIFLGHWYGDTFVTGSVVKNNWIYNLSGQAYALFVAPGSYDNDLVDNVIHSIEYRGIYLAQFTQGGGSVSVEPNYVERNAVWGVGSIGIEAHGAAVLRNNIVFQTGAYGIYSTPHDDDSSAALTLTNNTVVDTVNEAVYYRMRVGTLVLANNAVCNPLGYAVRIDDVGESNVDQATLLNNVGCGLLTMYEALKSTFIPGAGMDDFEDVTLFDFWPTNGSHLMDAGTTDALTLAPTDDFNGLARSSGPIDVGAYERSGDTNPGWTIAEGFKEPPSSTTNEPPTVETGCGACSSSGRPRAPLGALVTMALLAVALLAVRGRQSP